LRKELRFFGVRRWYMPCSKEVMDAGEYGELVQGDIAISTGSAPPRIELRWGAVQLPRGGVVSLDGSSPRSKLTRELLEAFRHERGRPLRATHLERSLWSDNLDPDALRVRLKVTVHRLRSAGFPIVTIGSGYAIDPEAVLAESLDMHASSCESQAA